MPTGMTGKQADDIIDAAKLPVHHTESPAERELDTLYEFAAVNDTEITLDGSDISVGNKALFFRGPAGDAARSTPAWAVLDVFRAGVDLGGIQDRGWPRTPPPVGDVTEHTRKPR